MRRSVQWQPTRFGSNTHATRGFTLIELVMVILILGVLAAVALPRFVDLRTDSVKAATLGMEGTVKTASNLIHLKCAATPGCNISSGLSFVTVNGQSFQIWNGWVDAGDNMGNNELDMAVSRKGFTVSLLTQITRFTHQSAKAPSACYVDYKEAVSAGVEPVVTSVLTGC
jgi:MSHA pilin protein MshA